MPGHHVVYACNCLNIKIQLANKYYLDRHEQYRQSKFTRIEEPSLFGWLFELSTEGVVIEYPSLIRVRRIMNNSAGWITVNCHNCSSGDVYSVQRPYARVSTSLIEQATQNQFGDHILIHQGAIFGQQIEAVQKKSIYSTIFRIVLNPDLPIEHVSLEEEDGIYSPELQLQRKQVQDRLQQSLIDLEEKTNRKIQAYRKEQELLLVQEKEKAVYDGAILWQTMKEVSKTIHAEGQRAYRLLSNKIPADQPNFDQAKPKEKSNHVTKNNRMTIEMEKQEPHVHFAPESAFLDSHPLQRRRSSAFKRDLFSGIAPASCNRRPSYVLDENHQLMAQSQRMRSSLAPSNVLNHHLHPLAKHKNNDNNNESRFVLSNNYANKDAEEEKNTDKTKVEDDDLFPLDEDIKNVNHYTYRPQERHVSQPSRKFTDSDDEQDLTHKVSGEDTEETTNFATSVPITIGHSPAFTARNEIQREVQKLPPHSSFIEPAYLVDAPKRSSFVNYDYAETDRRASAIFPPITKEKKLSTVLSPTYLEPYNNMRRLSSSKSQLNQGVKHGAIIPPHIFSANTVTDETEALFGSIPRTSIRNRPLE